MPNDSTPDHFFEDIFQKIIKNNPYGFILRSEIKEKTGGLLSRNYQACLDSKGLGIENRFLLGNTIAYPVDSVIDFLRKKISSPKKKPAHLQKRSQILKG